MTRSRPPLGEAHEIGDPASFGRLESRRTREGSPPVPLLEARLKEATTALREREKLLRELAHELGNPLSSIKSFTELLLLDERSEEDREALEIILREVDRAVETVAAVRRAGGDRGEGAPAYGVATSRSTSSVADRAATAPPAAEGEKRPLRILIADDERAIRFSLRRYLERHGHTVLEASGGGNALRLLDEYAGLGEEFDVIVADLRMPEFGGEELYLRLRKRGDALADRLMFITGDLERDAASAHQTAGVPLVSKPFELAEITRVIEQRAAARMSPR
jgi:CheY-like chemotaxis protein